MKTPFIISVILNIIFVIGLLLYMFTPIFDMFVIYKSLPRACEYATQHDAFEDKNQKTLCKFVQLSQ